MGQAWWVSRPPSVAGRVQGSSPATEQAAGYGKAARLRGPYPGERGKPRPLSSVLFPTELTACTLWQISIRNYIF